MVSFSRPPLSASESLRTRQGPRFSSRATAAQVRPAHQPVVEAGQLALIGAGIYLPEQLGDGEAQNAVAQKLQALVVAPLAGSLAHAGVGERLLQQVAAAERVAEAGLQILVFAGRRHGFCTDLTEQG